MTVNIQVTPNGPLKIEGEFMIHKTNGSPEMHNGTVAYLCRCGHSKNKPFCDGAHQKAEFKAE
jgi:CDGSH-type Zn-finger protein